MTPASQAVEPQGYTSRLLLVFCTAVALCALGGRWLPAGWPVLPLALAAIAVAVWHGAFDGALAQARFEPRWGARWRPVFLLGYLALAAAVACLWWLSPPVALAAFLLYSAAHFGTEMAPRVSPLLLLEGTATGFVPIAAACHWWPGSVGPIFAAMLRGHAPWSATLTATAGALLWPVVAVALLGAMRQRESWKSALLLIAAELTLFRTCSPLAAFAVFFCLWHTPEHLLSTSLGPTGRFRRRLLLRHLRQGLLPWLLSLAAVAALAWFGRREAEAASASLFIVLSALTVPHMVLAELCRRGATSSVRPHPAHTVYRKAVPVHGH